MLNISSDFPAGNIKVLQNTGNFVKLDSDLHDNLSHWFYWCFQATASQAGKYTFQFINSPSLCSLGPAISYDEGQSWEWLTAENIDVENETFIFNFSEANQKVMFSIAPSYLESNWRLFVEQYKNDKKFNVSTLENLSRQGRQVELAKISNKQKQSDKKYVMLTARHHCCEMTADYVLEGILAYALSHPSFMDKIDLLAVPFIDKDGVENGDQGKNRPPHDHARDYNDRPIYPEIESIKSLIMEFEPEIIIDLHCPHVRNGESETVFLPGKPQIELQKMMDLFSEIMQENATDDIPYSKGNNVPFGTAWNTNANYMQGNSLALWASNLIWKPMAFTIEIPYSVLNHKELNPERARRIGRMIAKSIEHFIC